MSTTLKGTLHGTDTKDTCEIYRKARKYKFTCSAEGGGNLRLKIKANDGNWDTIVDRSRINGGSTISGSFTAPVDPDEDGKARLKVIFSRGALTRGVDYHFFMEPA
ncbi:MAG: hypothetical protein AAF570_13540 [Bacteroidota bacterium]